MVVKNGSLRPCLAILLGVLAGIGVSILPANAQKKGKSKSDTDLIFNWTGGTKEKSRFKSGITAHGTSIPANLSRQSAVSFNGRNQWLESSEPVETGTGDFTVSVWVNVQDTVKDGLGDLVSQYDPVRKRGFRLGFMDNAVTMSHANARQLSFGIDNNQSTEWVDCGRPGNALIAFSMANYKGDLYAGTCEPGAGETGRVYRYKGAQKWEDCGNPDLSNAVMAMAVYDGDLYAGTGKYKVAGSSLPESENMHAGGRIFRYAGGKEWTDCGNLPGAQAIGGMVVFGDQLYASSLYSPAFYRYDKIRNTWVDCNAPDDNGPKRVVALAVYNDFLYATSYDSGKVYRYDGKKWTDCGLVGDNTQTYSFTVYQGQFYVATWPSGRVFRFDGIGNWKDVGRLGNELEVMAMAVHNGRFLAGTLPLAEIYSYEGDTTWTKIDQIDRTPDVKYRRAWTMVEHDGKVFCSTLPSGHIRSYQVGVSAMYGEPVATGWHHISAVKDGERLSLYLDGKLVANSARYDKKDYDLDTKQPLKIGFGPNDYFNGKMGAVKIYKRALAPPEILKMATGK